MPITIVHEFSHKSTELAIEASKAIKEHFANNMYGFTVELDNRLRLKTTAPPTIILQMRSFLAGYFSAKVAYNNIINNIISKPRN